MEEQKVGKLAAKMLAVMADIGTVEKRGRNEFHKYDYATEADIVHAVRAAMAKHGVFVFTDTLERNDLGNIKTRSGEHLLVGVRIAMTFVDTATGESFTAHFFGDGTDSGDKAVYKALTGAEKYALLKTFLIPTGDDPEKDETDTKGRVTARAAQPSAKGSDTAVISEAQRKRLFAICKEQGHKHADVKAWLKLVYGIESSREIQPSHYDAICKRLSDKESLSGRVVDPELDAAFPEEHEI